jgi:hypothetical protein
MRWAPTVFIHWSRICRWCPCMVIWEACNISTSLAHGSRLLDDSGYVSIIHYY